MKRTVIKVECYAGYRDEETPRRFHLADRHLEIVSVLDRWLAPDHRYFKVLADDGREYLLRHDTVAQHWEVSSPTPEEYN